MLEIRLIVIIIQDETKKIGLGLVIGYKGLTTDTTVFVCSTDLDKTTLVLLFSGL